MIRFLMKNGGMSRHEARMYVCCLVSLAVTVLGSVIDQPWLVWPGVVLACLSYWQLIPFLSRNNPWRIQ